MSLKTDCKKELKSRPKLKQNVKAVQYYDYGNLQNRADVFDFVNVRGDGGFVAQAKKCERDGQIAKRQVQVERPIWNCPKVSVRLENESGVIKAFDLKDVACPKVAGQIEEVDQNYHEQRYHAFFKPRSFLLFWLENFYQVFAKEGYERVYKIFFGDFIGERIFGAKVKQVEKKDIY